MTFINQLLIGTVEKVIETERKSFTSLHRNSLVSIVNAEVLHDKLNLDEIYKIKSVRIKSSLLRIFLICEIF